MQRNQNIQNLMELGLSEYEAKAYIALLRVHPVSAYEAARHAAIPTAKIYGVLTKLMGKEMVLELQDEKKKKYVPIDPNEYLNLYEQRMSSTVRELSRGLAAEVDTQDLSYIWNITGYAAFLERAEAMISRAEETILLSTWKEEWTPLARCLRAQIDSGVKAATVFFGKADDPAGQVYDHPIADTLYQERGGRGFALVTDGTAALMGTIKEDDSVQGAWSSNQGFVTLAEDYIKHDVYIMKIIYRFDDELIRRFGPGYRRLRDIFTDTEENQSWR